MSSSSVKAAAVPLPTLIDLSDPAVTVLLPMLATRSLCAAVLGCRDALPLLVDAFRAHFQLRLPPDAPRTKRLLELIQRDVHTDAPPDQQTNPAPAPLQALVTQFAVVDTVHATVLLNLPARHLDPFAGFVPLLPQLFHEECLPHLRVLASPFQESMVELAMLCPRLTHLLVPLSRSCAFLWMHHARVCVGSRSCRWGFPARSRRSHERGRDRALPSLKPVAPDSRLSEFANSVPTPHWHLQRLPVRSRVVVQVETMLRPTWGHTWETMDKAMYEEFFLRPLSVRWRSQEPPE